MSAKDGEKDLLSSWKEIANYLDCDVRTCYRWEEKYGLPVHRIDGVSKSRVFAYRHQIDEWLKAKSNNNQIPPKHGAKPGVWRRVLFVSLPIVLAAIFAIYFILIRSNEGSSSQKASGVPQSTGPLTLEDKDLVTTEFPWHDSLRIWRKDTSNEYKEVWRMEPLRHASIAIGNVDNQDDCEIVGPGVCALKQVLGDREVTLSKFFINVYKQGFKDWWKTTYFTDANCIFDDEGYFESEIAIGNIDDSPGKEIVLITMNNMAIFKYSAEEEEIKLIRSRELLYDNKPLFIKSVVLANIDDDETEEILIAADERVDQEVVANKGFIMIFKFKDSWPSLEKTINVKANLTYQSLRVGDVIDGGHKEIIVSAYKSRGNMYNTYILGWDSNGNKIFDKQIYPLDRDDIWNVHLDVGNLSDNPGEEIVVADNVYVGLLSFSWDGSDLVEDHRFSLLREGIEVTLSNVFVSDMKSNTDSHAEIMVTGKAEAVDREERFYLELLGFDKGFFSKWQRLCGEEGDSTVVYAGFGKQSE